MGSSYKKRAGLAATIAAGALAALTVAIPATSASAATSATRGTVTPAEVTSNIFNENSGKCLGIDSAGDAGIWTCTDAGGTSDQTWHWGSFVTGPYGIPYGQLINGRGQCLGVSGGSTNNDANIVGTNCLGPKHVDQYWFMDTTWDGINGDGTVLVNLGTPCGGLKEGGKVMGVSAGSKANGAAAVLWTDSVGPGPFQPNQDWYLAGPPN